MITGTVIQNEATIEIEVTGASVTQQISAVIDTGYNGYLTLPGNLVSALQLAFAGHRRATLADGSVVVLDVYLASVIWYGQQKDVLVSQAAGTPLIGMAMLRGSRLSIEVTDGGD